MNYRITGTGSCTPDITKKNSDFLKNKFLDRDGSDIQSSNPEIIEKFMSITGITERKYVSDEINCSDLATDAARNAIFDSKIDQEKLVWGKKKLPFSGGWFVYFGYVLTRIML